MRVRNDETYRESNRVEAEDEILRQTNTLPSTHCYPPRNPSTGVPSSSRVNAALSPVAYSTGRFRLNTSNSSAVSSSPTWHPPQNPAFPPRPSWCPPAAILGGGERDRSQTLDAASHGAAGPRVLLAAVAEAPPWRPCGVPRLHRKFKSPETLLQI